MVIINGLMVSSDHCLTLVLKLPDKLDVRREETELYPRWDEFCGWIVDITLHNLCLLANDGWVTHPFHMVRQTFPGV